MIPTLHGLLYKINDFPLVEDGYMCRSTALRFPVKPKAQIDEFLVTEFGSGQRRTELGICMIYKSSDIS